MPTITLCWSSYFYGNSSVSCYALIEGRRVELPAIAAITSSWPTRSCKWSWEMLVFIGSSSRAAWSFSDSLSRNFAGRDSNCHHLTKPCFLHKATSSSLSLSSVRVSTDQIKTQAPFEKKKKNKGQKNGKAPTIVAKGERHRWHSTFHQMSLGWNWAAEHCQYLCPSANSIFESHPMGFCEAGSIVLGTELQSASLSCWNEWQNAQGMAMKRPVDTTRRGRGSASFSQSVGFLSVYVFAEFYLFIA